VALALLAGAGCAGNEGSSSSGAGAGARGGGGSTGSGGSGAATGTGSSGAGRGATTARADASAGEAGRDADTRGGVSAGGAGGDAGTDSDGGGTGPSTGMGAWRCPTGQTVSPPILTGVTVAQLTRPPSDTFGRGFSIIEGPVWIGDALYVSQIEGGSPPPLARILKVVPVSPAAIFSASSGSNGLAVDANGNIVAAVHKDGSIDRIALADPNTLIPIATTYMGARFNAPNDLAVRSDGNIYFSDPDADQAPSPHPQMKARVYRIAPDKTVSVVDDSLGEPNGVTLSLDERTLFVDGSKGLVKYTVAADGSIAMNSSTPFGPSGMFSDSDGMVMDCAGDLYVVVQTNIIVLNAAGTKIGTISVPTASGVQAASNVAFGGADHQTLFITTLGSTPSIFTVHVTVPGMPY
jgi:gluconolactonase